LRETIKQLLVLQELDGIINGIKKELDDQPLKLKEIEKTLAAKNEELENDQNKIKNLETQKNNQEQLLFLEQEKLKKTRNRLSGSNVRHTSAYYANQREIEKLKNDSDAMESSLLELMQSMDEIKENTAGLEREIKELETERACADDALKSIIGKLRSELDEKLEKRKGITSKIEQSILSQYERIHGSYPENAICRAINEMCTGCHMNIPPQIYNEVIRAEKAIFCPTCQRILYYQSDEEAVAEVAGP